MRSQGPAALGQRMADTGCRHSPIQCCRHTRDKLCTCGTLGPLPLLLVYNCYMDYRGPTQSDTMLPTHARQAVHVRDIRAIAVAASL